MSEQTAQHGQTNGNGRDDLGRFAQGNNYGKQRRRADTRAYAEAFRQAVGPAELIAVCTAMLDRALRGNVSAARLIIEHCLGKPTVRVELAENDGEYRVAGESPNEHHGRMIELLRQRVLELRTERHEQARQEASIDKRSNDQRPEPRA